MLARLEVRRRWRGTVALALLVGAIGAIVLATAAGARRSDTALERFNTWARSSDVELTIGPTPTAKDLAAFRRTPGIAATARLHGYALIIPANENLSLAVAVDADMGNAVDRSRIITGRQADPSAPNELNIGESLASQLHLHVGSELAAQSYTPQQVKIGFSGGNPGVPAGPTVPLHVVGIVRRPLDLGVRAASGGVAIIPPGFNNKNAARVGIYTDILRVKTVRGAADVAQVVAAARRIWGREQTFQVQGLGIETEGARSAIDVLTLSLWIFAAVTALAGLVAISIVLTRDIANVTVDQSTLRSLGATRAQRISAIGSRATLIAVGGAVLAGLGALLLSPLFPLGLARRADPDVGLHADWLVMIAGCALVGVVVLAIAFVAAWRTTRQPSAERIARARRHTSPAVELAARAGMRPTATTGLRMALQPGTGATSVPVRSAFAGAAFGIAGITAVLIFGASLSHLVATPRLWGWTWDLKTEVPTAAGATCADANDFGVGRIAGVEAVAAVCTKLAEVDGRPVNVWGFRQLHGRIAPTLVTGRLPTTPREIALGAVTMRDLGTHIGDSVKVVVAEKAADYEVVGTVAFPTINEPQPLADGALMTQRGLAAIAVPGENETHYVLMRLAPGASPAPITSRLREIDKLAIASGDTQRDTNSGPTRPVEVDRLQQINWFPALLAALLAILALLAIGHTLVTSVRRRRRELALLKTMGFGRRQLRATIAWQATTLATVGLLVGIPVGLIVGNAVWHAVADGLGIAPGATIPVIAIVLTGVTALVVANLIAFFPGRAAARTPAAVALRAE
jgi:ABC-type antimicrobial peptide transport system permease subunit